MLSKSARVALALLVSVTFGAKSASVQAVYGDLSGRLTNTSGEAIVGAKVIVVSPDKGSKSKATTNKSGNYTVPDLMPGTYDMSVEADGFRVFKETGIPVFADQTSRVNVQLSAGVRTDPAASVAEVSILKTDRTDVATTFGTDEFKYLPIRDLNFTQFELLVPGALPISATLPANQNPQAGNSVNVNGQHFSGTAVQLDGTDNRDPLQGLIVINPTLESVSGMKFTTQNYGAEFGQATAGVVSIQTQSGTSSWHGSVFDFRRTDWGKATDPFSTGQRAAAKRNVFGGSLGGPLARGKLFFFGDYQGTRQSTSLNQLLSVPTARVRSTCLGPSSGASNCDLSEYPTSIFDPINPLHSQFKRNQIPNSMISQGAVNILRLLPAPNNSLKTTNNFLGRVTEVFDGDQFNARTDYNVSDKLKAIARYSLADFRDDGSPVFGRTAGGLGTNSTISSRIGFAGTVRTRNQELSSGFVYNLTPTLITDTRFGFFRYHLNLDSSDFGSKSAETIALTRGLNGSDIFSSGMPDIELPDLNLQLGYSSRVNNCNCPLREKEQQFQWVNNWTKIAGNHAFRWGADIRYVQNFRLASDRPRVGHLLFSPVTTSNNGTGGLGLATFLLGTVSSFDRLYSNLSNPSAFNAQERQKRWFFYGQDTWRVTPRLTLNYGLRWELYFPQNVTANQAGGFLIPNFQSPASSVFTVPGVSGGDRSGDVKNSLTNLGPRLGVAFLVAPTTVIRAGYGRSFDVGFAGSIFGISATQNPPVMISLSESATGNSFVFKLGTSAPPFAFPSPPFSLRNLNDALPGGDSMTKSQAVVYAVPGKMRLPTVDAWNLTVQHQLSPTMYFEIAYVGNKGTHVLTDSVDSSFYNINQASLENFVILNSGNGTSCDSTNLANYPTTGKYCVSKTITRQLFNPWVGAVRYFGNDASNNYNSLQTKVEKYFGQGYGFLAHYSWAKALAYGTQYFNVNPRIGYGPSNFDRTHSFILTNLWNLPIGKGKSLLGNPGPALDRIIAGWSINAITAWYSGLPFTPSYRGRNCLSDQVSSNAPCRPNLVGQVRITGNRGEWFTTTGGVQLSPGRFDPNTGDTTPGPQMGPWQRPAPGVIGNAGRNSLRGPGFFQSDVAIVKDTRVTEDLTVRFRVDVLNIFNKVNLANPGIAGTACVDCQSGDAAGATITSLARGALQRQFQFSLKLEF